MTRTQAVRWDYMGTAEVAAYCGVKKGVISNWRARGKIIEPEAELRMGPVWSTVEIIRWWAGHPADSRIKGSMNG